jgi:hypothetical protein
MQAETAALMEQLSFDQPQGSFLQVLLMPADLIFRILL